MFCYSHIQPSIMFLLNTFNYRLISLIFSNRAFNFLYTHNEGLSRDQEEKKVSNLFAGETNMYKKQ